MYHACRTMLHVFYQSSSVHYHINTISNLTLKTSIIIKMADNPYSLPFPTFHPQKGDQYKLFVPGFNRFIQHLTFGLITRGLGGGINGRGPQGFPNGIALPNVYQPNGYPYQFGFSAIDNIANGVPFPEYGMAKHEANPDLAMSALFPMGVRRG